MSDSGEESALRENHRGLQLKLLGSCHILFVMIFTYLIIRLLFYERNAGAYDVRGIAVLATLPLLAGSLFLSFVAILKIVTGNSKRVVLWLSLMEIFAAVYSLAYLGYLLDGFTNAFRFPSIVVVKTIDLPILLAMVVIIALQSSFFTCTFLCPSRARS